MALLNFNANNYSDPDTYDPIPEGIYEVAVIESALKPNSKKTGHYLELVFQVLSGEYEGRRLWDRLNIDNPSKNAEEIANKKLGSICRAVGLEGVMDSEELHDRPLQAQVIVKHDPGYDPKNEIKKYAPVGSSPAVPPQPVPAPAASVAPPSPATPAGARKPWER